MNLSYILRNLGLAPVSLLARSNRAEGSPVLRAKWARLARPER